MPMPVALRGEAPNVFSASILMTPVEPFVIPFPTREVPATWIPMSNEPTLPMIVLLLVRLRSRIELLMKTCAPLSTPPTVLGGVMVTSLVIAEFVIEMQLTFVVIAGNVVVAPLMSMSQTAATASWPVPAMIATTEVVISSVLIVFRSMITPPTSRACFDRRKTRAQSRRRECSRHKATRRTADSEVGDSSAHCQQRRYEPRHTLRSATSDAEIPRADGVTTLLMVAAVTREGQIAQYTKCLMWPSVASVPHSVGSYRSRLFELRAG